MFRSPETVLSPAKWNLGRHFAYVDNDYNSLLFRPDCQPRAKEAL